MTEVFTQKFNPPLKIYNTSGKVEIKERIWTLNPNLVDKNIQHMGYIGQFQLEEVWKRHNERVYISNYGYIALFDTKEEREKAKTILGDIMRWVDMNNVARNLIYKYTQIPSNKYSKSCKVCLNIKGRKGGEIHKIVAENFLDKPEDWTTNWQVHHIDSNSYNNSVSNLIWLPPKTHHGCSHGNHGIFHPMSYKGEINLHFK